jgi:hypothetical protein
MVKRLKYMQDIEENIPTDIIKHKIFLEHVINIYKWDNSL